VTQNDIGGEWMEVTPPSTTVTLTRVKPAELASSDLALVVMVLGIVGIVALVAIVYLVKKEK
jgi:hypothetical protein